MHLLCLIIFPPNILISYDKTITCRSYPLTSKLLLNSCCSIDHEIRAWFSTTSTIWVYVVWTIFSCLFFIFQDQFCTVLWIIWPSLIQIMKLNVQISNLIQIHVKYIHNLGVMSYEGFFSWLFSYSRTNFALFYGPYGQVWSKFI